VIEYANSESSSLFFYNPSVRRDSCVLSIELTLLLQSNSEEIKQISFVQHYKRKAVERSKATIQLFTTEEEAGSQQARQLIRKEGYTGSYKRGAYRGNRNDKKSLQGNIAELGDNICQYVTREQGEKVHQNDRGDSRLCQMRVY
jgi:hypothetical protein